MLRLPLAAAAFSLALGATSALAGNISVQGFDSAVATGASQAPGVWYVDRYAPAGFASVDFDGDDRLALTLSASDNSAGRGSQSAIFYATQGRKFDIAGANFIEVEFYLDPVLAAEPGRIAGVWGTGVDAGGGISAYPILELNAGTLQGYDVSTGGWFELGLPGGAAFGSWVTLGMMVSGTQIDYLVNDAVVLSQAGNGTVGFSNVILQAYNYDPGVDRTVYFDNLVAAQVPVPAALPLLGLGLASLGFMARRRRT